MISETPTAISLFTGAGIGDLGWRNAGFDFLLMNEVDEPRALLAARNFPETTVNVGDIWEEKGEIIKRTRTLLAGRQLDLLTCTAPCQGMSKNGQGTLLRNVRRGLRPRLDPRNRLILPGLSIVKALKPRWVVFENVSEMASTLIEDSQGELRPILEVIESELGPLGYRGKAYDLEFADFGVPQRRRRLITIYTTVPEALEILDQGGSLAPPASHSKDVDAGLLPWVSVADALAGFPRLDASTSALAIDSTDPFHRVPLLDERKYQWVTNTPPGSSAFDNQCLDCGFDDNPRHGSRKGEDGVNRANSDTPINCLRCRAVLPRPHVIEDGAPRIMRGYTSAYKRMAADLPAPTLTRNLSYACSDQKLHFSEHRVLSLAEAFTVHTLAEYDYSWIPKGSERAAKDSLIRLVLGESVPPRGLFTIGKHLLAIENGKVTFDPLGQLSFPLRAA